MDEDIIVEVLVVDSAVVTIDVVDKSVIELEIVGPPGPAGASGGKRYNAALASSTSQVITHSLNTRDVHVAVYNLSSPYDEIFPDIQHTSLDTVTVIANPAIPAGYGIVVLG